MTSGYRSGGADFDDLFDPYIIGPKSINTGRRVAGVDLSQRYAHIQFGTKRASVGHRVGGVDVSNLWAAKGTASYLKISDQTIEEVEAGSVFAGIRLNNTGTLDQVMTDVTVPVPGEWMINPSSAEAANYEAMASLVSGTLSSGSASTGAWLALSVSRLWRVQQQIAGSKQTTIRIDVRRIGSTVIMASAQITLIATRA